jgi:hypothetical protein
MPESGQRHSNERAPRPLAPATADERAIASLADVVASFHNTAHWYNNASFLLPLIAAVLVGVAGLLRHSPDLLGFAAFLAAVTAGMTPVVLYGWRQTPTTVVLTRTAILSLHNGQILKSLAWGEVAAIRRRETQGNVRWEVTARDGERILLDGELADLDLLVEQARTLAGIANDAPP